MSDQHGGYGPGPAEGQGHGHDEQGYRGFAAPHGADGSYVPEPLPAPLPPHAPQGTPYAAPPSGDDWSAHTAAQDATWQTPQQPPYDTGFTTAAGHGVPGYEGPAASYDAGFSAAAGHAVPGFDPAGQGAPYDAGFSAAAGHTAPGFDPAGQGAPYDAGFSAAAGHAVPGYEGPGFDSAGPAAYPAPYEASFDPAGQPAPWPQAHAYAGYADPQPPAAAHSPAPAPAPPPEAPARTGSPLIAPGIQPAALTAVLGLLLAGGAAVGKPGLTAVLVVLQAVTAAGWFRLNGMWPARQGIALAFLGGVAADTAMLAADGEHAPEAVVGTLGVWLLLVLVLQLRHHGSADERLSSLTATSASTVVTLLASGYLAALVSDAGQDPVVAGAVAVAAAALVRALPLPGGEPVSLAAALLAAAATGAATGPAGDLGAGKGLLLALACGACALIGLRVASYDFPSRFVHFTAGVALPLTAAAPVVYALGRALT